MKITVKLFPLDDKAQDGSSIPRDVFLSYLNTDDYRSRIKGNLMLGGVTHHDRNDPDGDTGLGEFDQLLMTGNITHYTTKMFIGSDNFVYVEAEVMDDPTQYEGNSKEKMLTLTRLLKNKILVPTSIVIRAWWNKNTDVCEEIKFIGGFDFTLSPGYSGSGVTKIEESTK